MELHLPELKGVDLLRKFCLHPTKSTKHKSALHNSANFKVVSQISTKPPSDIRVQEETRRKKRRPGDIYSKFLLTHHEDRPWRRGPKDLPLWDIRETLNNKAAILTSRICSDFCEWYSLLGGSDAISEEKVADLFAIRIPQYAPANKSNCINLNSISSKAVSQIDGYKVKETMHQKRPKVNAPAVNKPPEDLTSLACVFEDISHLELTQEYFNYLKNLPGDCLSEFLIKTRLELNK